MDKMSELYMLRPEPRAARLLVCELHSNGNITTTEMVEALEILG